MNVAPAHQELGAPRASRVREILVFVLLAGLVTIEIAGQYKPYTFLQRDASFYATITRGLAEDLSLDQRRWQPESWYTGEHPAYRNLNMSWSNVSVGVDGTWYPKHSYLMPVFATPFYKAFGNDGLLLFNGLCLLLMLYAAYLIARRYALPVAALTAVVLWALEPETRVHTYLFSLDTFGTMLTATGAAALLGRRWILAGVLLGFAIWARPQLLVLVAPLCIGQLWRRVTRAELIRFGLAISAPLGLAALANTLMYGAPWATSYNRILTVVDGVPTVQSVGSYFSAELGEGLSRVFLDEGRGLLPEAPWGLLGFAGMVSLWRRDRRLCLSIGVALAGFLAFYIPYISFDARFFLPWHALLCLPLALLLMDLARGVSWLGAALAPSWRAQRRRWLAGIGIVGGILVLVTTVTGSDGPWTMRASVLDAKVFRNTLECDYFNMNKRKWECSGRDRAAWEMTGEAVGKQCRFANDERLGVWMHPSRGHVTRRMRFETVPRGDLVFRYGLASSASRLRTCLTLSYAGSEPQELCATTPGEIREQRLATPAGAGPVSLEVTVKSSRPGKRHLCLDATVTRP